MQPSSASVVLPVKNEPHLPTLLNKLYTFGFNEIHVQTEKGLSNAVLAGVKASEGKVICVLDADGSHPAECLNAMVSKIGEYDIVIGSRYVKGGSTEDKWGRRIISDVYRYVAHFMFDLTVKDVMSGYIVVKREVLDSVKLKPVGFKWGLELLIKTKGKVHVLEYPIHFSKRKGGSSKADWKQGLQTFGFMLKLWMDNL
jgi:dolichol-phosphate mannosyltransferase